MFAMGWLLNGPEVDRGWCGDVRRRIQELLTQEVGPGEVLLAVHVGGSLGDPSWTGPGKPSRRKNTVSFAVGVPRAIQDEELETRLLDFADQALATAAGLCDAAGVPFDRAGHAAVLSDARRAISELSPPAQRRDSLRSIEERLARRPRARDARPETYTEPSGSEPSQVRIAFRWTSNDDLDQLFELQNAVDQALAAESVGTVDGNEVGEGTFDLFMAPTAGQVRRARRIALAAAKEAGLAGLLAGRRRR